MRHSDRCSRVLSLKIEARAKFDEWRDVTVDVAGSGTRLKQPAMILSMVDFPEPLVPKMPKTSPLCTLNDTLSIALNSLNMSSCFAKATAYSFKLFNCSLAMLKTIDTWSTLIITGRVSEASSCAGAAGKRGGIYNLGHECRLYVEDELFFRISLKTSSPMTKVIIAMPKQTRFSLRLGIQLYIAMSRK